MTLLTLLLACGPSSPTAGPHEARDAGAADTADTSGSSDTAPTDTQDTAEPGDTAASPDTADTEDEPSDLHGALPDDDLADEVGLQAALDATSPGDEVRLPPGVFLLAHPLRVPPGVVLAGAGMDATTLRLAPGSFANFGYDFLVRPSEAPTDSDPPTGVRDLGLDGNRRSGGASPNQGGGMKLADRWIVSDVRFGDLNYFKLWIKDTTGPTVRRVVIEDPADGASGDNDNVGGGGNTDLTLEDIVVGARTDGNAVDLLNSTRLQLRRLRAVRGSVYLEGTVDGTIEDNVLEEGSLVLQTDVAYGSSTRVWNPRGNTVRGNTVEDAARIGIAVRYDDDHDKGLPVDAGGNNAVEGNTVRRPGRLGIAVFGADDVAKAAPDMIHGNLVEDVLSPAPYTYNTGYGSFRDACIGLSIGAGDGITGNTCRDTQAIPTTREGIVLGTQGGPTTPRDTVLHDNVEENLLNAGAAR